MKESAGRMIAVYFDVACGQGLDGVELLRGLSFDPKDIHSRVSWAETLELLARIRDGLGGNAAMADAFVRFEDSSPDLVALAGHLVSPLQLATFINGTLAPSNFSNVSLIMKPLSAQSYEVRFVLAPGYPSNDAVIHVSVGLLRGQPRLLGLPEAQVTWSGDPSDFTCRVLLPPGRHAGSRLRQLSSEARARASVYLGAMLNDRSHYRHDAERLGRVLTRLGEAAQEDSTSEQLAEVAVRLLHEELGHAYSLVWSTRPPGRRLLASRGIRADNCLVVPLEIAGETLGILETDPVDGRETLASIAPLLALALRQRLDREAIPAPEGQFPSEWKLTKRQREVAELVLGGRSNAFVAASLGCSVATVEEHLTAIFGKAGVDGRQLLAARLSAFRKAPGR